MNGRYNMKNKSILGLIAVFVISAVLIAGCGEKAAETDTTQTGSEYTEAETETEPGDEPGDEPEQEPAEETVAEETVDEENEEDTSDTENAFADFTVYDLSQNETTLDTLISGNKVTMLNFWGTFCGPCIGEMPDLADIERQYKDKGFEIVGVTIDAVDFNSGKIMPDIVDDAKAIMKDTNVEYPVVLASPELIMSTEIEAVPTTFFVDKNGELLTEPFVGSRDRAEWESIISDLLE